MTTKDPILDAVILHKLEEVKTSLGHQDFLFTTILETLNSFAFRYLDQPRNAVLVKENDFSVSALELGIKEAIKNKNPELRAGISELVKRVSKAEGPTILREIRVVLKRDQAHSGNATVSGKISFGHPEHDFSAGTFVEKVSTFPFIDEIHLRNELSKHLEVVCELF